MFKRHSLLTASIAALLMTGCSDEAKSPATSVPTNQLPSIVVSDITVDEQVEVTLTATVTDDGEIAAYSWQQTSGIAVTLDDSSQAQTKFTAPTVSAFDGPQTLGFTLTATDDKGAQSTASINVIVNPINQAPVATIAAPQNNQSFGFTDTVLDGSLSSDSDGQIAKYQWQQISGEAVALENADSATLTVKTHNKAGNYTFELTVTDNEGESAQSTVSLDNQAYFLQVAAGHNHHCALVQDGNGKDVYCWGSNTANLLDVPALTNPSFITTNGSVNCAIDEGVAKCWGQPSSEQLEIPQLNSVTSISVGYRHSCAIDANGASCWGIDYYGETVVPQLKNPSKIIAGMNYSCALDDNGVNCWGRDQHKVLNVPSMTGVTGLYGANEHACAIYDGGVKCWGDNNSGQLMDLATSPQLVEELSLGAAHTCVIVSSEGQQEVTCVGKGASEGDNQISQIPELDKPRSLTSANDHSCVIDNTGVHCWGGYFDNQTTPPLFDQVETVTSGISHSCAIGRKGDEAKLMQCWGYDFFENFEIPNLSNTQSVSINDYLTCAINDEGPRCWGYSIDDIVYPPIPGPPVAEEFVLSQFSGATQISPGYQSLCILGENGVECWGDDYFGYLGTLDVPTLTNPTQLASGDTFHCAVADEGLKCWGTYWGYNFDRDAPELTNVTSLSAQDGVACAIADNQVHCWGSDTSGLFDIPELTNPSKVTVGAVNACAIDASGVVCWGSNNFGQTRVPALTNPTDITVGYGYACAIDEGALVCWGWDGFGSNPVPTREQAMSDKAGGKRLSQQNLLPKQMPTSKKKLLGPVM